MAQAAVGAYDLIIYDRCQPPAMPQSNTLFIGVLPPDERWTCKPAEGSPVIIDIDHVHPLTQLLEMNYVEIAEGRNSVAAHRQHRRCSIPSDRPALRDRPA